MPEEYTLPLKRIAEELGLKELWSPKPLEEILICSRDVDRPALELNGFCDYFDASRVAILGRSEIAMLRSLDTE